MCSTACSGQTIKYFSVIHCNYSKKADNNLFFVNFRKYILLWTFYITNFVHGTMQNQLIILSKFYFHCMSAYELCEYFCYICTWEVSEFPISLFKMNAKWETSFIFTFLICSIVTFFYSSTHASCQVHVIRCNNDIYTIIIQ